ncbi:MAG: T9SS type A sorting domain-containing protein, partial [Candidatus Omnitrophota bacterium]
NTYNWSFGDGGTSTIANPVHFYATNGTYYAKLVTTNFCGTDSSTQTVVVTNASINESSFLKNFNIYPNPTNHSVNITLTSATSTNASILIYDLLGNAIYNENIIINTSEYNHKVDVSTFGKGIYFITLKSNNTTISKKLIVY